ncbi:MAG: PEP-CTERM sorting domain-containing protein [Phycisphaeraceae bacterium]|nr:PEP-CTERM sorting domain-containing protein [Phycisphaeraceae bacterium]
MTFSRIALSSFVVAGLAGAASGAYIDAKFLGVAPGVQVWYSINNGALQTAYAGGFNFKRTGGSTTDPFFGNVGDTFTTFCIDLQKTVSVNSTYGWDKTALPNAPTPPGNSPYPMGAAKAALLGELWARHHSGLSTNDQYGAFQMAVWEIVFEDLTVNSLNVALGDFKIFDGIVATALAQIWLNELDGSKSFNLYAITGNAQSGLPQDQLVPTPGSLALVGLGGLAMIRRRRH